MRSHLGESREVKPTPRIQYTYVHMQSTVDSDISCILYIHMTYSMYHTSCFSAGRADENYGIINQHHTPEFSMLRVSVLEPMRTHRRSSALASILVATQGLSFTIFGFVSSFARFA